MSKRSRRRRRQERAARLHRGEARVLDWCRRRRLVLVPAGAAWVGVGYPINDGWWDAITDRFPWHGSTILDNYPRGPLV